MKTPHCAGEKKRVRGKAGAVAASVMLVGLLAAGCGSEPKEKSPVKEDLLAGIAAGKSRVIDLTHALDGTFPAWTAAEKAFEAAVMGELERDGYFSRRVTLLEHFGTHLDAPAHFAAGRETVDQIPAEKLFGPAVVLDVRGEAAADADYRVTAEKVAEWEARHGRIPRGAIVLLRTGWAARAGDGKRYRNEDAKGVRHFPGYSLEAAKLLVDRGVSGLGIDSPSVDYGPSTEFEVHRASHGAGLYHLENLADLGKLPESGAFLVVAPIKLTAGSGGPARVFAIVPQ